jgi:carbonic anhydrase
VDQLRIEHLMVVGHYGCGGVLAALEGIRVGLADNWIRHVQDVRDRHRDLMASIDPRWRHDVLCELNAIEQVVNIAQTTVMLDAWGRGQKVTLHGWCYGLKDGLINNLQMTVDSTEGLDSIYRAAIAGVAAKHRE